MKVVQPIITSLSPLALTINNAPGSTASFTVAAIGDGIISYQWYSKNGATSTKLTGQTSATATIVVTSASQALGYYVVVSSAYGKSTSDTAQLTVQVAPSITTQPAASQTPVAGNNANFSVVAAGGAPLYYQWNFNGAPIPGATTIDYSLINVQAANDGTYTCTVTNIAVVNGVSVSATTSSGKGVLAVKLDTGKPTVTITEPKANTLFTNGTPYTIYDYNGTDPAYIGLAGTVKDTGLITNITILGTNIEGGSVAAISNELSLGSFTFSNNIPLSNATNHIQVSAYNTAGNNTLSTVLTVIYVNPSTFTVNINTNGVGGGSGLGTVTNITKASPIYGTAINGGSLAIGVNYSFKAVPGPNTIFTNWTDVNGHLVSTNLGLTNNTMTAGLTLNANFLTNPIVTTGVAGSYNGLYYNNTVGVTSSGFIGGLAVGTNRVYSGTLKSGGNSYTITGTFDLNGNATNIVSRAAHGQNALTVGMNLDWTGGNAGITGTVSDSLDGWTANL